MADEGSHEDCASPKTALDSLPHEVVAHIFKACLPTGEERRSKPLHALAPLTLSWVSASWRRLCLASPELWTSITLGHSGSDPQHDIDILRLWFHRSAQLSLALGFDYEVDDAAQPVIFDKESNARYVEGLGNLLDVALTCVDRWEAFSAHVLDVSVLEHVFLALVRGAPMLSTLALSAKYLGFFGDVYLLDFSECPSLANVILSTPMIIPTSRTVPMTSVTDLELRFCTSINDCLRWLDLCPLVAKLTVRLFCSRPDLPNSHTRSGSGSTISEKRCRRLERLSGLEIHAFSGDSDPGSLLDQLETPALKHFKLNMYDTVETASDWVHVNNFIERSQPVLEVLDLSGMPLTGERLIACLQRLDNLKALSARSMWHGDELLSALAAVQDQDASSNSSNRPLCPSLEELDIVNSSWSTEVLASTLSSRLCLRNSNNTDSTSNAVCTSIRRVVVNKGLVAQVRGHPDMRECLGRGLRILGAEARDLHAAFSSPRVVFI